MTADKCPAIMADFASVLLLCADNSSLCVRKCITHSNCLSVQGESSFDILKLMIRVSSIIRHRNLEKKLI